MEANAEPITLYGLLAGESGDWTLQDISEAMKHFSDTDLIFGMAIVSRLGPGFQLSFGGADLRFQRIGVTMGAVGTEIQRRGGDPFQIDLDLAWQHWCQMMYNHGPETEVIPTHRLAELQHVIHQAIPLLGEGPDAAMVGEALNEAAVAIGSLLTSRGLAEGQYPGEAHHA